MKKFLLALPAMALVWMGCSSPKIALNGDGFTELPVKGRNGFMVKQKLSIGPYQTSAVKRSWTRGGTARSGLGLGTPGTPDYDNIISKEYTRRKQTLNFTLSDDALQSEVRCVTRFSNDELIVGNKPWSLPNIIIDLIRGNRSSNTYYIQMFLNNQSKPWQLMLDNNAVQASPKKYSGILALDDEHFYYIVPIYKMLNKKGEAKSILGGSVGFDIRNSKNESVAAISMMDNGKFYLKTADKTERFLMVSLASALLLQQQIDA